MPKIMCGEVRNPHGRPKGTGYRQKLFNALVVPHSSELIATAIELARNGNTQMLSFLLTRILPVPPSDEPIPECELTGTLSEQGEKVIALITSSRLSLVEGRSLLHALSLQAKLIETDELDRRLKLLEGRRT
ncbi:MAG: hypothetical protein ABI597_04540 [Gammaproteobacteria bacterium]